MLRLVCNFIIVQNFEFRTVVFENLFLLHLYVLLMLHTSTMKNVTKSLKKVVKESVEDEPRFYSPLTP